MRNYEKVEGSSSLVKDADSKAVLTTDLLALENYKAGRAHRREMMKSLEDINNMKDEMAEIKALLKELLNDRSRA
jgi:ribosomal protein S3AE